MLSPLDNCNCPNCNYARRFIFMDFYDIDAPAQVKVVEKRNPEFEKGLEQFKKAVKN